MNMLTPPKRGLDFEERARRFFSLALDKCFSKEKIRVGLPDIQVIGCTFDLVSVSSDHTIIGDVIGEVKDYTWRKGVLFPNSKFEQLKSELQKLQFALVPAQRKLVIMKENISLEGKSLIEAFINRLDKQSLHSIEVWRYDTGDIPTEDSATQVFGPNVGTTLRITDKR